MNSRINMGIFPDTQDSERLRVLYQISEVLMRLGSGGLAMDVILPQVLELAREQLQADGGSIFVGDKAGAIQFVHAVEGGKVRDSRGVETFLERALQDGLVGRAIDSGRAEVVENTMTDSRWLASRSDHFMLREPWSAISVPLIAHSRPIGAITLHKPGEDQFGEADEELLVTIANQAASTIENTRLYEEAQRQLRVQTLLNEASRVINSSLDVNEILHTLLSQMNEFLNAEAISIALVDPATEELVYTMAEGVGSDEIVGLRLPASEGISGWVMEHAEPALVGNTGHDDRFSRLGDERTHATTQAIICAPLHARGRVLGTIQAINPWGGEFTEHDLNLLIHLANLASTAIDNAQQYRRAREAEARYMALFEDSINPIILTDLAGYIIEVNRRASDFFGHSRLALIGRSLADLHPPQSDFAESWSPESIHRGDKVRVITTEALTQAGQHAPVEVYAKRTVYGNQQVLQCIYLDISEQVELDKVRRDLTAMLFHDLQSPLSNIISSLQLLELELPPDMNEPVTEMLEIAMRNSQRLQALIRSLLDIQRMESEQAVLDQSRLPAAALIDEAAEVVSAHLEQRNIWLERRLAPSLPDLIIDKDMILRVLVNLLDNAIKYTSGEQTITVEVSPLPDVLRTPGGHQPMVLLSVSDQGPGIPAPYRETIFEKFRRVDSKTGAKGLGLGLAFCRLAVEAHGGRIWVDEARGGGAKFCFTLPVV